MSDSLKLISELIKYIEDYRKNAGNSDINEFSSYLNDRLFKNRISGKEYIFDKNEYHNYKSYAEIEFSILLTNLFRFAKHYIKKAFAGTEINTIDEFGFLASLLKNKSMLKKDLINQHLLEISTGSEILKRLIKNGLIKETPDLKDKRAKQVSLTPNGEEVIIGTFNHMHRVSEIIIGNLSETEINQALQIFNKLNFFHHNIYDADKTTDLLKLHKKYIIKQ